MGPHQRQYQEYESELTDLHADIEEKQGDRQQAALQSESRQRAREADTVNQAKRESDHPGIAGRQSGLSALLLHDLDADERDAQRDAGIERPFRHADQAESRR